MVRTGQSAPASQARLLGTMEVLLLSPSVHCTPVTGPVPHPRPKAQFSHMAPRMRYSVPGSVHWALHTVLGETWHGSSLDLSPEVGLLWDHTASQRLTLQLGGTGTPRTLPSYLVSFPLSVNLSQTPPLPGSSKEQVLLTHRVT